LLSWSENKGGAGAARQTPFDVAVILPTLLRPSLDRAVRSVFAQDFTGRIQVLVGIDVAQGERAQLEALARDCPAHIALDIFDPGYSTSVRHGGLYPNRCTGSLRTVMSYAANSRYLAYLDDDNWWAPDHLGSLRQAIENVEWCWSLRWFVEPGDPEPICIDTWESVGPGAGHYAESFGGFVDPSSLMIDKLACHHILPYWSLTPFPDGDGRGSDRLIFSQLKDRSQQGTGRATSFYTISPADPLHLVRLQGFRKIGVSLPSERRAGVMPLAALPGLEMVPAEAVASEAPMGGEAATQNLLGRMLGLLRPAEAVVLGAGDGADALTLARVAQAMQLDCLVVAEGAVPGPARQALQHRIAACGLAQRLRLLAPGAGMPEAGLAVDLVQLGPAAAGPAAWQAAFGSLRPGGFLLGRDPITAELERFAATSGSNLLPIPDGGPSVRWILERGVGAAL
jgi:hypothetical protein